MKPRGFSLPETLIAMFLVFLVLSGVAGLVQEYSRVMRHSDGKDRSLNAFQVALDQMRGEVGSAVALLQPSSGSSNQLSFQRLDPGTSAARLPTPVPSPLPGSWEPRDPADLVQVTYLLAGGNLVRRTATDEIVAEGVEGLLVTRLANPDRVSLTVTVREERLLRTFSVEALLWVAP